MPKFFSTMIAAAVAAMSAAPSYAQDLSIGVYNFNPYGDPSYPHWDWHWGPVRLQATSLTVGGQEYFEIGVANSGAPIVGPQTITVTSTLPKGVSYFAASPPWQCASAKLGADETVTCGYPLAEGETIEGGKSLKKLYLTTTIGADLASYGTTCASVVAAADPNAANNSACSATWLRYFAGRPALWGDISKGQGSAYYVPGQTGRTFYIRSGNEPGDPLRKGMKIVMTTDALHPAFINVKGPASADPSQWNCVTEPFAPTQRVRCEKTLAADLMHGQGLGDFSIATDVGQSANATTRITLTFETFDSRGVPVLMQKGAKVTAYSDFVITANPPQ